MPVLAQASHMLPVGGDATVPKKPTKAPLQGNIVKTMMVGNTTIHFCDDCIETNPVEIDKIIDQFYAIGYKMLQGIHEDHIDRIRRRGFLKNQELSNTVSRRRLISKIKR